MQHPKVIQIRAPERVQAQHTRLRKLLKAEGVEVWRWLEKVEAAAIARRERQRTQEGEH